MQGWSFPNCLSKDTEQDEVPPRQELKGRTHYLEEKFQEECGWDLQDKVLWASGHLHP